jgi:hypothetical protein
MKDGRTTDWDHLRHAIFYFADIFFYKLAEPWMNITLLMGKLNRMVLGKLCYWRCLMKHD